MYRTPNKKTSTTWVNQVSDYSKNTIATIFSSIGVITIIIGFIAGIIVGNSDTYSFQYTVAFIYWISSFISGMFFIGFGEVVKLLTSINEKLDK